MVTQETHIGVASATLTPIAVAIISGTGSQPMVVAMEMVMGTVQATEPESDMT